MMPEKELEILWITENYPPNKGGMSQSCDRIVNSLQDLGAKIHILHLSEKTKIMKRSVVVNGSFTVWPIEQEIEHSVNLLWLYIENHFNKFKFTHILAFGGYLPIFLAPVFSKWMKLPLITLIRGNDFDMSIFSPKKREILLYALENSEITVTISSEKKEKIKKLLPHKSVHQISNGIDVSRWQPLPSDFIKRDKLVAEYKKQNCRIVGIFGQLKNKKGVDFLIDAIHLSNKQDSIFLLIAGEITDDAIIEKINTYPIAFSLHSFMDRYDLISFYMACDIVAIPSFYDGMPNVLLEAGSVGVPFLGSDTGGISDFIQHDFNGLLFQPNHIDSCAFAIRTFMELPTERLIEMGENCKKLISEKYTNTIEAQKYLYLFKQV